MGNESIEEVVSNIKYLLKEAEEHSNTYGNTYYEGWYNGECNAYEIVLEMLEKFVK